MEILTGTGTMTLTVSLDYDGGPDDPAVKVQFYGRFKGLGSIANVCRQWCLQLLDTFPDLGIHDYSATDTLGHVRLEPLWRINRKAPLAIFYGFPHELEHEKLAGHQVLVGAFVCETDKIKEHWVECCNRLDLVVVPSIFCRDVFVRCGVTTPVMVVPHGLEPEFQPVSVPFADSPFVFYNVLSMHSNLQRKSALELIECFLEVFRGRSDVKLVLRTENEGMMLEYARLPGFAELVEIEPVGSLDTAAYARYFSQVHCTVHPSRSEGFGLVPLQSLACGTPVIAIHETGMKDYLDSTNSIELPVSGTIPGTGYDQAGNFPDISRDDLKRCLLDMLENRELHRKRALVASTAIRKRWSWPRVMSGIVVLLKHLNRYAQNESTVSQLNVEEMVEAVEVQRGPG